MLLRLLMFLRRERGNATSKASSSNTTARRTLGDYQRETKQCPLNVSVLNIVGDILWNILSYLLTHCIPVAWATMGGARSPIMTKNAMHVPIFSPITLCVCVCV